MRSLIIGLLLFAPSTFAQQSSISKPRRPQTLSVVNLVECELISGTEPRRETLLACSGSTRTTLVRLNQDRPQRLYDSAEVNYCVVAGEGAIQLAGRDTAPYARVMGGRTFSTACDPPRRSCKPADKRVTHVRRCPYRLNTTPTR
jgi:hypothetical protein